MRRIVRMLACFTRSNRGAAMLEFAITIPVLIALFLSAVELSRYIMILQKVDKAAYTIADVTTINLPATSSPAPAGELDAPEMRAILDTFGEMMQPLGVADDGVVIVTSIEQQAPSSSAPVVKWQVAGGGTLSGQNSNVNGLGPSGITPAVRNSRVLFSGDVAQAFNVAGQMNVGENVIIVEVFFQYRPIFGESIVELFTPLEALVFKRNAFFNPRFDPLLDLPPDFTG